jgi:hypothetical protein
MKALYLIVLITYCVQCQNILSGMQSAHAPDNLASTVASKDSVSDLIRLLDTLALNSDNALFKQHCSSIINVVGAKKDLSGNELAFLAELYATFSDSNVAWNASHLTSYLERKRPFILSWTSPTDGVISLAWLVVPQNWNPEQTYPLYVSLHGLYAPYDNPIEYMTIYLSPESILLKSFEDGYSLYPWGRGNLWYEGISETDVWESISSVETIVKVNPARKYLVGHSMGGYGVWSLGQKSPDTWAALGIYAGALSYGGYKLLNATSAQKLKDIPIYFVCGDQDGLMSDNQTAYQLMRDAGDSTLAFATFSGGHVSLLENWQKMYEWIRNWTSEGVTSVQKSDVASHYSLIQNYPNPFNPTTTISYSLPSKSFVSLKVFDLMGREVSTIVSEEMSAGNHSRSWNALHMPSGVYFYRIQAGRFTETKKFVLLK